MKRWIYLLCVFSILVMSGCSQNRQNATSQVQDTQHTAESGNNFSNDAQSDRAEGVQYTDAELDEMQAAFQRSQYSREDTAASYDPLFLDNGAQNVAGFFGETKLLICYFDADGALLGTQENGYSVQSAEFDAIAVGNSLQDVIALDPNGSYLFPHTGRNDLPHTSTHYTPDRQEIVITYDVNDAVQEVTKTPFI